MKIGIDIRELEEGKFTGIGRYLRDFLLYCAKDDTENEYLLFGNQHTDYQPRRNQSVKIIPQYCTPWWDQVQLPHYLKKEKINVFLTPYFKAPIFPPCPMVIIINDLIPIKTGKQNLRKFYFKVLGKLSAKRANKIIAISREAKNDVVEIFSIPSSKIEVVYLSVEKHFKPLEFDKNTFLIKYNIQREFILYLGNLKPHKNISGLIKAYARLSEDLRVKYRLVIVGWQDDNYGKLTVLVRNLGISRNLLFIAKVKEEDAPLFYNAATVFVFPSFYEGFGLPPLEAMACGTPVITSNTTSLPEVINDCGILVNPHRIDEITSAIKKVLTNKELRENLIKKGLLRAKQFPPERMYREILEILEKCRIINSNKVSK